MNRFLIDENLSPRLAAALRADGHDALHVNEAGLHHAADRTIMRHALEQGRTVVTQDHDFMDHLRGDRAAGPSVIRISQRGDQALPGTDAQVTALRESLTGLGYFLERGAAVSLDRAGLRIDPLPMAITRDVDRSLQRTR